VSGAPWQRLPPVLAGSMRRQLPTVVAGLAEAVAATATFAAIEDAKFRRDVDSAVVVALERFLDLVGTDQPALVPEVQDAFVALGAAEARDERGPDALLAALRSAARVLFRTAAASLADAGLADTDTLIDLGDAINAYIDELAAACTDGYALQVREQAGEGDRRRRLLAELLLRGDAEPDAVAAAAADVGWRSLETVQPVLLALEHARDARFRFGADGLVVERERDALLLLRGGGARWGRSRLAATLRGRAAVVGPALGWARVADGVRLAQRTAELTRTADAQPEDALQSPVFVDDHLAALALRGVPGALTMLTARRLAPLDARRSGERERLLRTLHSWLRHWGSRSAVAAELSIHPQTVSYRLRRLHDLFGDALQDPTVRFELMVALSGSAPEASR